MSDQVKSYKVRSSARRALKRTFGDEVAARAEEFILATEDGFQVDFDGVQKQLDKEAKKAEQEETILRRSEVEGPCALVWDIAEQMEQDNPDVKRKEIIEACMNEHGIAYYTARTQLQHYKAAKKEAEATKANAGIK